MVRAFHNMPLGRRLSLIVLFVSFITLCSVVYVALSTSSLALRNEGMATLVSENRVIAGKIDEYLGRVNDLLTLIINETTNPTNPTTLDVQNAVRGVMRQENSLLIRRIVFYSPQQSVGLFNFPNPASGGEMLPQVVSQKETQTDTWFVEALQTRVAGWHGPDREPFSRSSDVVVSHAILYPQPNAASGSPAILWAEISIRNLQELLRSSINNERFNNPGYSFLISSEGKIVTVNTANVSQETLLHVAAITQTEGATVLDDPLPSGDAGFAIRSTLPLSHWALVTVLPNAALPALPTQTLLQITLFSALGLLLMIASINLFVYRTVARPIQQMGKAAQRIGEGDMQQVIEYQNNQDEIGVMARALEEMRRDLQTSYDTLEQRVHERTAELEIAKQVATSTAEELRAVYDESLSVVTDYQLDVVLDAFTQRILRLLRADYCGVWLIRTNGYELRLVSHTFEDKSLTGTVVPLGQGLVGLVAQTSRPVMVDNYGTWENRLPLSNTDKVYRALCVPLISSRKPIGAVMVGRAATEPPFDDDDKRLLILFANMVSPSVRNAQLIVQLEDARKAADQANMVKTRFLASVTHELRTPLNLIINNMDFMRIGVFGEVSDEQIERLDQTIRSSEHLLYLINDLLDASKIEAGEMKLFMQPTDIYPILEDALDSALILLEKDDNKISRVVLNTQIPPDLPMIPADARRVRQVLYNLLNNAVKFTNDGEVSLEVTLLDDYVKFTVRDTGIGIREEDQADLFKAFERSEHANQMGIEGTGLGLAISRYFVEAHGGTLMVESTLGQGTAFSFTLPRVAELQPKGMTDTQIIAIPRM